MGLLDQMIGGALGGALGGRGGGRGMGGSPVVRALLIALAAKAAHSYMTRDRQPQAPQPGGGSGFGQDREGGGGLLGGLLGGGAGGLGGLLSGLGGAGALGSLVDQFRQTGHGEAIDSWIKPGPNRRLAPEQLSEALGDETLGELEQQTGMPRQQLLSELSEELPDAVDQLTPQGRLPDDDEIGRMN